MNDKIEKIIVFSEPSLTLDGTVNNAMNEILEHYLGFSKEVVCVAPGDGDVGSFNSGGVEFIPFSYYSKKNRIFFHRAFKVRRFVKEIIARHEGALFQFRLPSIYVLQLYIICHDLFKKEKVFFYLAGDWFESLRQNYPKKKISSIILDHLQNCVISNSVVVFTGDVLFKKHQKHGVIGHAFYSTTHTEDDLFSGDLASKFNCDGVCFIGTMDSRKNPSFMLKLSDCKGMEKKKFHWLGDGCLFADIKSRAGVNVKLHGHISDRRVFDSILSECKYFILPSYTEGTSKTLPEVMARGVLPIAFEGVGSNNYIIDNGENGFLIAKDDVSSVVDIILELDSDSDKYERVLHNAKVYAGARTVENEMMKMFVFLRETLKA